MKNDTKPIAVLISDVHYNIHTLPLADAALNQAVSMANKLDVDLIVAGDLHDTKANLRGECIKAIRRTLAKLNTRAYVLVGNHDLLNEKSEEHSLHFLEGLGTVIVSTPMRMAYGMILLPYFNNLAALRKFLLTLPRGSTLVMHQGCKDASSYQYIQDATAIRAEELKDFRVISGHYHTRQDIKTVGLFSFLGNPYTLGFGEANDPEKGFSILRANGVLEFVPTNLRKHVILEFAYNAISATPVRPDDIVWVKIHCTTSDKKLKKEQIKELIGLQQDFKLDYLVEPDVQTAQISMQQPQEAILDQIIETSLPLPRQEQLKALWRSLR